MRRKTQKRSSSSRKSRKAQRGGLECPKGYPPRLCDKYMQKWKNRGMDPEHVVTPNFKRNLRQSLYHREKRLLSEEERVKQAREKFNWKSRIPKFNEIRRGLGRNNNISNNQLLNVHEATNVNFPEPTGVPEIYTSFPTVELLQEEPMRKKIYRNNQ